VEVGGVAGKGGGRSWVGIAQVVASQEIRVGISHGWMDGWIDPLAVQLKIEEELWRGDGS
jgi:hypothetical protein